MSPLAIPGIGVTLVVPGALIAGAGAAAAIVAAHMVRVGRPRPVMLPTARFAPERPPRAARRLAPPGDLALLALRLTTVGLASLALARPVPTPERRSVARVVAVDVSRAADPSATRRALAALAAGGGLRTGDVLVPFAASAGAPVRVPALASTGSPAGANGSASVGLTADGWTEATLAGARRRLEGSGTPAGVTGSLSTALVAARRAAGMAASNADSVELVVVSPFHREAFDAATLPIRATWAGRARLVPVGIAPATPTSGASVGAGRAGGPTSSAAGARSGERTGAGVGTGPSPRGTGREVLLVAAAGDDPVAAALALAGRATSDATAPTRVVRRAAPSPADLAWAAAGGTLVVWPSDGAPEGWSRRPGADGDGAAALVTGLDGAEPAAVVGPWTRSGLAPASVAPDAPAARPAESTVPAPSGRVVARWADGRPAAVERPAGAGCVRTVAVRVPSVGDLALRPAFGRALAHLVAPCGPPRDLAPLPPELRARLAGQGPLLAAAPLRAALAPPAPDRTGAALLAAAALALLAELALRPWLARRATRSDGEAGAGVAAGRSAVAPSVAPGTREAA